MKKGKALRASGENARAILEFRNAVQAVPKDAEPYYQLGLAYLGRDDVSNAAAMFSKAVALNPKHSQAQLQLASFAIIGSGIVKNIQLMEEAQQRIAEVLSDKPDDANALELRAITEYKLGHTEAAQQDLQRALEKSPTHLRSAISLANLKLRAHDIAGADAILKLAIKKDPKSAEAALAMAQFYLGTGRKSEAESEAKRAGELDPKNITALTLLAALQSNSEHTSEAEQTYQKLSALPDAASKPMHAIFLFQHGRRDEAVSELRRLTKGNPDDRNIRGLLVTSYVALGRPQEAERLLTDALKRNPHDVDALFQQSAFYLDQRQYAQAEAALQAVLRANPDTAAAHYRLSKVNAARGARPQQADELREALRLDPALLEARLELAQGVRSKNPKAALQLLDEAKEGQKKSLPYRIARNWTLLALRDHAAARQELDAALAVGKSAEVLYQDACLRFEEKDYEGSRKSLEEALKQNPEHMAALDLLARSYAVQNNATKALEVVEQYAAKRPSSPYLGSLAGSWQIYAHHLPEAKAAFQAVISANPKFIPARLSLAQVEVASADPNAARDTLKEVLIQEPGNVEAAMRLANIEIGAGNRVGARDYYQTVVQADPNNADALNNLAYILCDDKPDEALKYAQSAVEMMPENPDFLDTLGWVYYRKGIYLTAVTNLKAAVAQKPTAEYQYHLALAYGKAGNQEKAQENLKAALRLDPKLSMPEQLATKE